MPHDFAFDSYRRIPAIPAASVPCPMDIRHSQQYSFHIDFLNARHIDLLRYVMSRAIWRDRLLQAQCANRFKKAGIAGQIQTFHSMRGASGSFPPDYVDLCILFDYIRAHRPRRIVELGSGVSTLVMALALHQNGDGGSLLAIDPNEEWAASTAALLPDALRESASVEYSPGVRKRVDDRETVCFADALPEHPDMIYIDGSPKGAVWLGAESLAAVEHTFGTDLTIFLDGRSNALQYFENPSRSRNYTINASDVRVINAGGDPTKNLILGFDQFSNSMIRYVR